MKNIKRGGQAMYKGANSQADAALALFLQYLRDPKFIYIHLEPSGFQDFNLHFDDDKVIICESKSYTRALSYSQLRKILSDLLKKNTYGDNNEILIVCEKVSSTLKSRVNNIRFFDEIKKDFKKHKFTKSQIALIDKVRFWETKELNLDQLTSSLLGELIGLWMPLKDLEKIKNNLLQKKIYARSQIGGTFSREEMIQEIKDLAASAQANSVYYDKGRKRRHKQFQDLEKALRNSDHGSWRIEKELSAFSADSDLLIFARAQLDAKTNTLILRNWNNIWQLNNLSFFSSWILDIFERNLHSEENRDYAVAYLKKRAKDNPTYYRDDYLDRSAVDLLKAILEKDHNKYLRDTVDILEGLIERKGLRLFYLSKSNDQSNDWGKDEICRLLEFVYIHADPDLKERIINLVFEKFNLIRDDGELSHHTPPSAFSIIKSWLSDDLTNRLDILVGIINQHYSKYYKGVFKGWEWSGGGISFGGSSYRVSDRHFVESVLKPSLEDFYRHDPVLGWNFILNRCVSKTNSVSASKPDYLNRSVYGILIEKFLTHDKDSQSAFHILSEFLLSKKGIPHKSDLIYQFVESSGISDKEKWMLAQITTDAYKIPVNPFVEKIVANLVKNGNSEAGLLLRSWLSNPDYYRDSFMQLDAVDSISNFLDSDILLAADLLKILLTSDYFKSENGDTFHAHDVAELMNKILKTNYDIGLQLVRILETEKKLSPSQQTTYVYCTFNQVGGENSDNAEYLLRIYRDVLDPFFSQHLDIDEHIRTRINEDGVRVGFVQFAERLAKKGYVKEALRIINIFINDPDPYMPGHDPKDHDDKYCEHKKIEEGEGGSSITSVRGWCGWVLMLCITMEGRPYLSEIETFIERLIKDENYYVVHMACWALDRLAEVRLLLTEDKRPFLNDELIPALQQAKRIEGLAFDLMERLTQWPPLVQQAMTKSVFHALDSIRALNEDDAMRLIELVLKLPDESISEVAPLFIYLAELRKNKYLNWNLQAPSLYDDLAPELFHDKKFKKILITTIKRLQKNDPDLCFRFASSVEHLWREAKSEAEKIRYSHLALEYFTLLSNRYGHGIFNIIYLVFENKFSLRQIDNAWMDLLFKCFKTENRFYKEKVANRDFSDIRWYPTLYHSGILSSVYEQFGEEKFLSLARIFFSFPTEIDLNESEKLVSIILRLSKTNKDARSLKNTLKRRSPRKYYKL